MNSLYEELKNYTNTNYYPFHMPGHKRHMNSEQLEDVFTLDITEIEGFDNLHCAEGILKESMEYAASVYGAEETFFLVNGSTVGILAAISALCSKKGKILMARNCHKSAYNAAFLNELDIVYVYPEFQKDYHIFGGISPKKIKDALQKHTEIEAVIITSPTYDGVVSDVKTIADIVHEAGIPLIVDEAHGAHFGFTKEFPENALRNGADIVIHSVHKTLPSLTQTALLHISGNRVCKDSIHDYLSIYQSSSPSYILMASIDTCVRETEKNKIKRFSDYYKKLQCFREEIRSLSCIKVIGKEIIGTYEIYDYDMGKLIISVKGSFVSGQWLYDELLHKYHLQMEMAAGSYVLAMTSIMDTDEGFSRLAQALKEIDKELYYKQIEDKNITEKSVNHTIKDIEINATNTVKSMLAQEETSMHIQAVEAVMRISEAKKQEVKQIALKESAGCICGEYIFLYPPGIPMIVPGEIITNTVIKHICYYIENGFHIHGMTDNTEHVITIIEERKETI